MGPPFLPKGNTTDGAFRESFYRAAIGLPLQTTHLVLLPCILVCLICGLRRMDHVIGLHYSRAMARWQPHNFTLQSRLCNKSLNSMRWWYPRTKVTPQTMSEELMSAQSPVLSSPWFHLLKFLTEGYFFPSPKGMVIFRSSPQGSHVQLGCWSATQFGPLLHHLPPLLLKICKPVDKGHLLEAFFYLSDLFLQSFLGHKQKLRRGKNNLLQQYLEQKPGP